MTAAVGEDHGEPPPSLPCAVEAQPASDSAPSPAASLLTGPTARPTPPRGSALLGGQTHGCGHGVARLLLHLSGSCRASAGVAALGLPQPPWCPQLSRRGMILRTLPDLLSTGWTPARAVPKTSAPLVASAPPTPAPPASLRGRRLRTRATTSPTSSSQCHEFTQRSAGAAPPRVASTTNAPWWRISPDTLTAPSESHRRFWSQSAPGAGRTWERGQEHVHGTNPVWLPSIRRLQGSAGRAEQPKQNKINQKARKQKASSCGLPTKEGSPRCVRRAARLPEGNKAAPSPGAAC